MMMSDVFITFIIIRLGKHSRRLGALPYPSALVVIFDIIYESQWMRRDCMLTH